MLCESLYIPEPNSGCWLWLGARTSKGYGRVGKNKSAHRVMMGEPKGLNVNHRCDNPSCVNPDHLYVGTQSENMQDMWKRGRRATTWEHKEEEALTRQGRWYRKNRLTAIGK